MSEQDHSLILHERARLLARVLHADPDANEIEIVLFRMAQETYGLESVCVREVYRLTSLTPVPGTPAFVLGITSLRGEILSIVDLHAFFELPSSGITEQSRVIVLEGGEMGFGILADAVLGTRRVSPAALLPMLLTLTGARDEYLRGMTDDRVIVLDGHRLLASPQVVVGGSS